MNQDISLKKIWSEAAETLTKRPQFFKPFALVALASAAALLVLINSSSGLFSPFLEPFIRYYYGPNYLFYPDQTQFLGDFFPKVKKFLDLIFAPMAIVWLIRMLGAGLTAKDQNPRLSSKWTLSFFFLLISWALGLLINFWFQRFFSSVQADTGLHFSAWFLVPASFLIALLAGIFTEWIFMFSFPSLVFSSPYFIPAAKESIGMIFSDKKITLGLVCLPLLSYGLISILMSLLVGKIWILWPDILPTALFADLVLGAAINTFFIVSVTLYYFQLKGKTEHVL